MELYQRNDDLNNEYINTLFAFLDSPFTLQQLTTFDPLSGKYNVAFDCAGGFSGNFFGLTLYSSISSSGANSLFVLFIQ